ncbi:hypothetical protein ACEQ8H_000171 [Pleosporales sp. CAS-2024a]
MDMLAAFPHLTPHEFDQACSGLCQRYRRPGAGQSGWQSVHMVQSLDTKYLSITKELQLREELEHDDQDHGQEAVLADEDDEEALDAPRRLAPLVHYHVLLSPVYRVPVLYVSITDAHHRYPPTMATLYEHLMPEHFKAQAENAGLLGGVTIHDHPVTNRPVFFIHPCQTATVMEAAVGKTQVTAEHYLLIWMGALAQCVGLNVPLQLMRHDATHDHT